MIILITTLIFVLIALISKILFKKWFNHLTLYSLSWSLFIILYEIRLINYIPINFETWIVILITFFGFVSGAITVFSAKGTFEKFFKNFKNSEKFFLSDEKNLLAIRNLIIICSLIGLASALQHWYILINKFGNIETVLIRANLIYRMRVAGELEGTLPYLHSFAYAGVFLSGIYSAYKSRFSIISFLPLIAVILKDVASIGRGGIFVAFLLFITSFLLSHHKISENDIYNAKNYRRNIIISGTVVLIILLASLSFVKEIRGSIEVYKGETRSLSKLKDVPIISPSIYLYLSSNVGVLSKYFELQAESPMIGENTFLPVYNLLAKFDLVEKPPVYPRGYSVPVWSNAATYLRDIHADFGLVGLFAIPFLLSLCATFFWLRFFERGDYLSLVVLSYLFVTINFSVFYLITRAAFWVLSFLLLVIFGCLLEKKHVPNFNTIAK